MKRRDTDYSAPSVEKLGVKVEAGFAASPEISSGNNTIPDLEFDD